MQEPALPPTGPIDLKALLAAREAALDARCSYISERFLQLQSPQRDLKLPRPSSAEEQPRQLPPLPASPPAAAAPAAAAASSSAAAAPPPMTPPRQPNPLAAHEPELLQLQALVGRMLAAVAEGRPPPSPGASMPATPAPPPPSLGGLKTQLHELQQAHAAQRAALRDGYRTTVGALHRKAMDEQEALRRAQGRLGELEADLDGAATRIASVDIEPLRLQVAALEARNSQMAAELERERERSAAAEAERKTAMETLARAAEEHASRLEYERYRERSNVEADGRKREAALEAEVAEARAAKEAAVD